MAVEEEDLSGLGDEALEQLLIELQAEEEEISRRRRKLHDRLASFPNEVTQQQEREISAKRRALHVRIDALRSERSRRRENASQE